jgi:hypothetical protein
MGLKHNIFQQKSGKCGKFSSPSNDSIHSHLLMQSPFTAKKQNSRIINKQKNKTKSFSKAPNFAETPSSTPEM